MKLKPSFHKLKAQDRLYQMTKPILGLTGGIATGKSSVSELLKAQGFEIICADSLVKEAYQKDEVKNVLAKIAPEVISKAGIDFKLLREKVFTDVDLKQKVESLIYAELPALFRSQSIKQKQSFIIYDVPLLFERNFEKILDQSLCVYCSPDEQKKRLLKRDKSSNELIDKILASQISIEEKKKRCDYLIDNSGDHNQLKIQVQKLIQYFFE